MEKQLAAELIKAAQIVEERLDDQIKYLETLEKKSDESEIEELRRRRIIEMRKAQEKRQELILNGHGRLQEFSNEPDFFQATKNSNKVVCHFFDVTHRVSAVVDNIFEKLAAKYISTLFVKVNAERVPFLIKRLNIRKLPTLGVAIDSQMVDFVRVIEEFGTSEDIKLEAVESRLSDSGVIDYRCPPTVKQKIKHTKTNVKRFPKKSIRERKSSSSDDSADW